MPKKPLKKKDVKKPQTVIINPDLDEKGSPVVEGAAGKVAYGVGYLTGKLLRTIGKEVTRSVVARPKKGKVVKFKKLKEAERRWKPRDPWKPDTPLSPEEKALRDKKAAKASRAADMKGARMHRAWAAKEAMKEESLDELSKKTLKSYKRKAEFEVDDDDHIFHNMSTRKYSNREDGIERAKKRLRKEESLDEISKRTVKLYQIKAGKELRTGPASGNDRIRNALMKGRMKGHKLADKKMHGGAKVMATEEAIDELFGKGSIDTIGKHHAARSTKGKTNSLYHAIQKNRAARVRDIHKGTGPLGKTTWKGRAEYARQDRAEAKKLKPVSEAVGWNMKKDRIKEMSPEEHLGMIKQHADKARKFGQKTLMGQFHARHAARHIHYMMQKDKSRDGAIKAMNALKEEYADIFEVSNYKDVSPETKKQWADTTNYLERRHDEIVRRHKQGHSTEKIAKDMKLHPAIVSATTGSMKEEVLDELSREKLQNYQHAASADWRRSKKNARRSGARAPNPGWAKRRKKRAAGLNMAHAKLTASKVKVAATESYSIDEAKRKSMHSPDAYRAWLDKVASKPQPKLEKHYAGNKKKVNEAILSYDDFVGKGHHRWNVNYDHGKHKGKNLTVQTKEKSENAVRSHRTFDNKKGIKINSITYKGIRENMELDEAKRGRPRKVQDAESNEHINMQLRKSISLRGQNHVVFGDGTKHQISPTLAHKALHMHDTLRTSIEKGEFAKRLAHSHNSFMDAVAGKPAAAAKPKITLGAGFGSKHIKK